MIDGVPKGLDRQVMVAFVAALRTNPVLANNRVIKTWLLWDGKGPVAPPTIAQMPAIQIRMVSGSVKRLAGTRAPGKPMSHVDESHPSILIDLWTPGNDQFDIADLSRLIYAALAPQDLEPRAQLQDQFRKAGIRDWQLTRQILPTSQESFSQEAIAASGSYELTVIYNS